ncbi:MAG: 7-cyano-7-deazaguanine synthase, partial [Planctomycetota bacterium]
RGAAPRGAAEMPPAPRGGGGSGGIPPTYVPARNLVFLSLAAAVAEARGIRELYIGVNALDYSGYPDCRPEFIDAFQRAANLGTREGSEHGEAWFRVHTPLIALPKSEIIRRGAALGVDYSLTLSCYDPDGEGRACGRCDACGLRRRGFEEAGLPDPTLYR